MKSGLKTIRTILTAIALMALPISANAAVVAWQAVVAITGDTNVATTGTLVGAFIPGANALSTTVNGVAFSPVFVANNWDNTTTTSLSFGSVATLAGTPGLCGFNRYETGTPSGLSADYTKVFSGGVGPATNTANFYLTLNNLTIGQDYLFQSWANESRGAYQYRTQTITGNGSQSGVLDYNVSGVDGGAGCFVIGTFTADATTQVMLYSADEYAQINAFQVRNITAVPEPSSLALAGLGIAAAAWAYRRRK